jgi:hypothetical protein
MALNAKAEREYLFRGKQGSACPRTYQMCCYILVATWHDIEDAEDKSQE